jgi:hypothetical protein
LLLLFGRYPFVVPGAYGRRALSLPAPELPRGGPDALGFEFFRLFAASNDTAGLYRIASGIARGLSALRWFRHQWTLSLLAGKKLAQKLAAGQQGAISMPAEVAFVHDDPEFIERAAAALRAGWAQGGRVPGANGGL